MSFISKLLVKINPINFLYTQKVVTPNVMNEMRRNISKRYTIGKDCEPEPEPEECPDPCRKVKKPLTSKECSFSKKRSKKRSKRKSKSEGEYGDVGYGEINKKDPRIKGVRKRGKYTSDRCDPFPRDEHEFRKKFIKCKATMRNPCDPPVPEHKCTITKGKLLYTTNKRPKDKLPNCPKGNWKYTDRSNKRH